MQRLEFSGTTHIWVGTTHIWVVRRQTVKKCVMFSSLLSYLIYQLEIIVFFASLS